MGVVHLGVNGEIQPTLNSNHFSDSPKQKQVLKQPQQREKMHQTATVKSPWWQSSPAGYAFAFPIVGMGVGQVLLGEQLLPRYYFPGAFLLVAILCVALFWGVGPGLLATVLSCLALLFIYFLPLKDFGWEVLFQILPFALAGLAVAVIASQRELARQRAIRAEQISQARAQELSRINQELYQTNQLKDLFVAVASHELRTPITTIRGRAQLALRRLNKAEAFSPELEGFREAFMKVDEQTKRLETLLNELLDLTSLRSGKHALNKETCNLNEISSGIVEEQRLINRRTINLDLPSLPVLLQADAIRLGQLITNLISNALKYSPAESIVRVKIERHDSVAQISVQDAGRGIPSEQLANIFRPFYRTSDARTSAVSGTGLGLAICKDIVEQHQGRIWCESQLGSGTLFLVELPLLGTGNLEASVK
jgi:signal transduction histidine kinase